MSMLSSLAARFKNAPLQKNRNLPLLLGKLVLSGFQMMLYFRSHWLRSKPLSAERRFERWVSLRRPEWQAGRRAAGRGLRPALWCDAVPVNRNSQALPNSDPS